jgi:hypothetical protein
MSLFTKFVSRKRYFRIICILFYSSWNLQLSFFFLDFLLLFFWLLRKQDTRKDNISSFASTFFPDFSHWLNEKLDSMEPNLIKKKEKELDSMEPDGSIRLCWVKLLGPYWWELKIKTVHHLSNWVGSQGISIYLSILTYIREYLNRINLYRRRVWACKVTGKVSLTYEEALVSEKRAAEKVQQFPKELMAPALHVIQYSKHSPTQMTNKNLWHWYVIQLFFYCHISY